MSRVLAYSARALDTLPPPTIPDPPAYVYGPSSIYPHEGREKDLCESASSPDWLYLAGLVALDVGAIWVQSATKYQPGTAVRLVGPGLVGLTWGATLGGGYLALPKCDPHWVGFAPREGKVRKSWPLALSIALLGGVTAPVIVGIANGFAVPLDWTTEERSARVLISGGLGFVGALLPYVLPPKTWSAAKELERIRADVTAKGAFVTYGVRF